MCLSVKETPGMCVAMVRMLSASLLPAETGGREAARASWSKMSKRTPSWQIMGEGAFFGFVSSRKSLPSLYKKSVLVLMELYGHCFWGCWGTIPAGHAESVKGDSQTFNQLLLNCRGCPKRVAALRRRGVAQQDPEKGYALSSVSVWIHAEGNPPLTLLAFGSSNSFCDLNDSSLVFLWCESPSSHRWQMLVSLSLWFVVQSEKVPGLPELGHVPPSCSQCSLVQFASVLSIFLCFIAYDPGAGVLNEKSQNVFCVT